MLSKLIVGDPCERNSSETKDISEMRLIFSSGVEGGGVTLFYGKYCAVFPVGNV
jgi:hypothetical protein